MKSWERKKAVNNKKRQKVLKIAAVGVGRDVLDKWDENIR